MADGTHHTFPEIPSGRLSSIPPDSTGSLLMPGFSFKHLRLSSHPWVRAHLRSAERDPHKPRLSLLAKHRHMYGPECFSKPQGATLVVSETGVRSNLDDLQEASKSPSLAATNIHLGPPRMIRPGHNASAGPAQYSRSASGISRAGSSVEPDTARSAPRPVPDLSTNPSQPHCKSRKHGKQPAVPLLAMSAFSSVFSEVLSDSEDIFGHPEPLRQTSAKKRSGRRKDGKGCPGR
ncbi:hypothetical protein K439DRAFT_1659011 [Ramaria rubella]|nr:hypothetical protein K439DRAFT_1659011 [Ramaria rubella]